MSSAASGRMAPGAPAAMVLAAGLGTRLRPLTNQVPKPLVPLGDRPLLAHIGAQLAAAGVSRIALNTHHLPAAFCPEQLARVPLPVALVHEPLIRGTAGGVAGAAQALGAGAVVVHNGDIVADCDFSRLLHEHRGSGALATLAVRRRPVGAGTVGVGPGGEIVRLRGQVFGAERAGADFAGVQVVSAKLRGQLPEQGCLVGDGYLPALRDGLAVRVAFVVSSWTDIGTLRTYLDANLAWLARKQLPSFAGPGVELGPRVQLVQSVVGADAAVGGEGPLERCVVWPGARVTAPLADAIVMTDGQVVPVG